MVFTTESSSFKRKFKPFRVFVTFVAIFKIARGDRIILLRENTVQKNFCVICAFCERDCCPQKTRKCGK